MIKDSYCCSNCFENEFIKDYINENFIDEGDCPYCKKRNVKLIQLKTMGEYIRDCINKKYELCVEGTGAIYDSEEKTYVGPDFKKASVHSIKDILLEIEMVFSDSSIKTNLLDDLFENLYSDREIQKGSIDSFDDIDSNLWVIKNNLYGYEQIEIYHTWEFFKHYIKHYCRFFEPQGFNIREQCLKEMDPYISKFVCEIPKETKFYRVRKVSKNLLPITSIEPYSQMGPPPADYAKTNRMSPAGIPYLYLASNQDTALKECRIDSKEKAIVAEFVLKKDLKILDLTSNEYFVSDSIFDPNYNHDITWMNSFFDSFKNEISKPVSTKNNDHSYEYTTTQLVAEYYRMKGYDGICFKSSVGTGENYVFFMGPDTKYTLNAYSYPFDSYYNFYNFPTLNKFTDAFCITSIAHINGNSTIIETRKI